MLCVRATTLPAPFLTSTIPGLSNTLCLKPKSLLDRGFQCLWVGADNLLNLLAVLEELECGHGADAEIGRYVGYVIDVELVELRVRVDV